MTTTPPPNQHYLIVGDVCRSCSPQACECAQDEQEPDYDITIECPGVVDNCRGWMECVRCSKAEIEDDQINHGERHRVVQGRVMTDTGSCWIDQADNLREAVHWAFLDAKQPYAPGRYPISHDCPDLNCVDIFLDSIAEAS